MPGWIQVSCLTNSSLLELEALPRHLVIVGGSYIGLEFAQMYRRFGSEVTVVEKGPRLVLHEDEDVSEAIKGILEAEGIRSASRRRMHWFRRPVRMSPSASIASPGSLRSIGSHVLLAVGRDTEHGRPGARSAGVALDRVARRLAPPGPSGAGTTRRPGCRRAAEAAPRRGGACRPQAR